MSDERITDRPAPRPPPAPGRDPDWPSGEEVSQCLGGFFVVGFMTFFITRGLGIVPAAFLSLIGAVLGGLIAWSLAASRRARGVRVRDEPLPAGERPRLAALPWSEAITTVPIHKPTIARLGGHRGAVSGLAFSPDGGRLGSGDEEGAVVVHDLRTGFEAWAARDFPYAVVDLAYSRDGRLLAVSGNEEYPSQRDSYRTAVRVYDALDGRELRRIEFHVPVGPVVFLPDRRLLIGISYRLGLWELETPSEQQVIPPSMFSYFAPDDVRSLAVRDRIVLVGCSQSRNARVLSLDSGEEVLSFEGHNRGFGFGRLSAVVAVAVSPSGDHVLSGSHDGTARLWALRSGEEMQRFSGHWGWWGWHGVTGVGWLSDDEAVSTGDDGTLRVWDARTGQELARLDHGRGIRRLALMGRTAATGASDGSIRLWALT